MTNYRFRIRTTDNQIIGNISYSGTSQPDAERKLLARYRGATILDVQSR